MMRDEWGIMLICGWNSAGWINQPALVGDRIGKLIGAPGGTVVVGDKLSIKVYQALASALEINAGRKVILSDTGNFPSDLYITEDSSNLSIKVTGSNYASRKPSQTP